MSTYGQFVSHPLASGLSMSTYNQFAWLPLAGGLTGLGLVASYFLFRRRGVRAGLRGVAWSLLPLAAYLTGSIKMIWEMASAITGFATSFLFSPEKWAGVAVAGLAFVLFVVTGMLRRPAKADLPSKPDSQAPLPRRSKAAAPADNKKAIAPRQPKQPALPDDDDFSEVEKILRSRGIN
ncbi:MAG TPA: cellulose synthase [Streptosporangiaceae bacterium]|nr:cellulose synthase [Streptosporangiaceae bacterium]